MWYQTHSVLFVAGMRSSLQRNRKRRTRTQKKKSQKGQAKEISSAVFNFVLDNRRRWPIPSNICNLCVERASYFAARKHREYEQPNDNRAGVEVWRSCRKAQSPSPVPSVLLVVDYSTVHYCRQYLSNTHYYNYITRTVLYVSTVRGTAQVHRSHVVCN